MKNVSVRFAVKSDRECLLQIYAVYVKKGIARDRVVPSAFEFEDRIQRTANGFPFVVCQIDGQIVGYAYVSVHEDNADNIWTTIYISDLYHRNKIGKALYTCILDFIKLQGYERIHAIAMASNEGSIRFHESFGFKQVGEYPNAIIMEKKFEDCTDAPNKTISIQEIDSETSAKLFANAQKIIEDTFRV